jgi:hypothetical protein
MRLWLAGLILPWFFLLGEARAGDILVSGSWTETIDESDLQSAAGSELNSSYLSAADASVIDILVDKKKNRYEVDVRKLDATWNASLLLFVRRTSNGQEEPGGSISQGTTFQQVTDASQPFFTGKGDRSNVAIQYRVDGVSLALPPASYRTTVYYTVIDR